MQGAGQRSCAEQCQRAPPQFAGNLALSCRRLQQLAVAQPNLNAAAVGNMLQNLYNRLQARCLQGQAQPAVGLSIEPTVAQRFD